MKHKLEINGEWFEVMFDCHTSLRSFDELDVEIEEVICLDTGCEVPDDIVKNNDMAMQCLEEHFRNNYEPLCD